ncbi:hypothetical protein CDD82_7656 [Ophiocordyceps australis]|uniref:Xylanolytic transcriptional activator regulatory domain-containing protein n=1 Tax=Ophiocordyceps australis TaxID=1399860 RepID=A0A2C5YRE4_9HYPO|nr:hypothetical protein CDD82_7656 [Ophiocordyceps australis]
MCERVPNRGEQARASESALQAIVHAIVDADDEDEARAVVERIRGAHERNGLEALAKQLAGRRGDLEGLADAEEEEEEEEEEGQLGEVELARNMGELRLEGGVMRFIGGTSHLVYLGDDGLETSRLGPPSSGATPATSWTRVTDDAGVVSRLLDLYFAYHYAYFATLSKDLFWRDFARGRAAVEASATAHCSALLVNVMLALGCHFCDVPAAYATPHDSRTKGDHFFNEAKRILMANDQDELARPRLVTVQALALMSVREAGCAREAKGWVYSGMSFRMAHDIGLNLDVGTGPLVDHAEVDARRITFWGCVLFDSCWSNYLGRLPQLPRTAARVSKFDVVPAEDAQLWRPLTDDDDSAKDKDSSGYAQPGRTRATALHLAALSQISSDLLLMFYHPSHLGRPRGKTAEVKALGDVYRRLEQWRKQLPGEFEPREGQLPHVILMQCVFLL